MSRYDKVKHFARAMTTMTKLRVQFAERLKYLRLRKKLTQEDLAEAVGLSVEFISNMERAVNAPSFETLENLALSLDVRVKDLFDFEDL